MVKAGHSLNGSGKRLHILMRRATKSHLQSNKDTGREITGVSFGNNLPQFTLFKQKPEPGVYSLCAPMNKPWWILFFPIALVQAYFQICLTKWISHLGYSPTNKHFVLIWCLRQTPRQPGFVVPLPRSTVIINYLLYLVLLRLPILNYLC